MEAKDYEELSEYVQLEGTEIGEYCNSLLIMRGYNTDHGMSDRFDNVLEAELSFWLLNFRKYAKITEKTETETRTYKELEWID